MILFVFIWAKYFSNDCKLDKNNSIFVGTLIHSLNIKWLWLNCEAKFTDIKITFLYRPDQGLDLLPLNAEFSYRRPQEVEAAPQQPNGKCPTAGQCFDIFFNVIISDLQK